MIGLVDTNILVYRFDPRSPAKQAMATDFLLAGIASDLIVLPHQGLVEFIARDAVAQTCLRIRERARSTKRGTFDNDF